jgi:hypothetical protein
VNEPPTTSRAPSAAGVPASRPVDRDFPEIDTNVAHAARVYDYLLGGDNHFAVDRAAANAQLEALGTTLEETRTEIRANRAFLGRAVRHLAGEVGIRQFLDLGTGIPNEDNVHGVAHEAASDARVVYVDNDPIVLAHAHSLLRTTPDGEADYVDADLTDPPAVLRSAAATLDFDRPVAVMLISLLHLVPDEADPYGLVHAYMDSVCPGSHLVITQLTKDIRPEAMARLEKAPPPDARYSFAMRSHAEVSRFFDGLELLEPGVVTVDRWRPDGSPDVGRADGEPVPFYGGIGRKP